MQKTTKIFAAINNRGDYKKFGYNEKLTISLKDSKLSWGADPLLLTNSD